MTPSPPAVCPLRVIFSVATALGFFSAFAAFYFVSTFTDKPAAFGLLLDAQPWLLVFVGGADARHPVADAPLPVRSRDVEDGDPRPHRRRRRRHVAARRASPSRSRMGTYWVDRRVARHVAPRSAGDVVPELRLGDDDLLDHRRRRHGAALSSTRRARKELNAAQLETRLVEARLHTLQRQMQPHFLFNTLNTISALMHRDVEAADAMIARLSDLLRMSLQRVGVQEVSLKEELDFLSKYLEIEQTRFRDRLTVVFDVQADTLRRAGPQPFAAATRRKRHQARHWSQAHTWPDRRAGPHQWRDARARRPGQRRRAVGGAVD